MSTDYSALEGALVVCAGPLRLIAVSYLSAAPPGVEKFSGTVPSGCTFWSLALTGDGFYTVPGDHLNCPIGSYTHAIDLPADARPRARTDLVADGRHRLRADGGSAVDSAPVADRRRSSTTRRSARRRSRLTSYRRRAARPADAAAGSRGARRRRLHAAAARPADVHGAARRDGPRLGHEHAAASATASTPVLATTNCT